MPSPIEHHHWFLADPPSHGAAMVVHGLNMKPEKMDTLAELLRSSHIDTLRLALTGHRGDTHALQHVTRKAWLRDVAEAYDALETIAAGPNLPHYFVGFSLGGLLIHDFLLERQDAHFDRMVLLAPGIALTRRATMMRIFELLRAAGGTMLPSLCHSLYRANTGTSIAAYNALLDSYRRVHTQRLRASNIPTLVITDPNDALVSAEGINRMIADYRLTQWSHMHVDTERNRLRLKYHHLITDPDAVGEEEWQRMAEAILSHLR